jgi:DNA-binding response OmpR family regulator
LKNHSSVFKDEVRSTLLGSHSRFKTLLFLVQNPDRVISRDELLKEVRRYQNHPSTHTVDNHILRLRQKLERDITKPVHLRTVHGMNYKFVR